MLLSAFVSSLSERNDPEHWLNTRISARAPIANLISVRAPAIFANDASAVGIASGFSSLPASSFFSSVSMGTSVRRKPRRPPERQEKKNRSLGRRHVDGAGPLARRTRGARLGLLRRFRAVASGEEVPDLFALGTGREAFAQEELRDRGRRALAGTQRVRGRPAVLPGVAAGLPVRVDLHEDRQRALR